MKRDIFKNFLKVTFALTAFIAFYACSSSDDNGGSTIGDYKTTPVTYMEGTFSGYSGKNEATAIVEIVDGEKALIILTNNVTGVKNTATVYVEGVLMLEGIDPTVMTVAGEIPSVAYNHKTKKLIIAGRQGGVTMTFSGNKI
ncbi:hypothetical protein [Flavobacterium sp. NKUCC04_CG]|uniref:hypothetical protein n=1 Tax=Flavobacterium sp. NKUCC04_CG TaxID=2842121 RepID=UPI001C5A6A92|nr:hypothetical protein [Flavobacterium sp. NKUCC04_CG]MBW3517954.1 hypothetical protein [Flavobacterium sp. NKUCC04_CG]